MEPTIRRAEPGDYEALQRIFDAPLARAGTLQLPYPSQELWRKRLSELSDRDVVLLACVDGVPVGQAGLHLWPNPRRSHAAWIGMAVRDDHAGKGIGSALMRELLAIADGWMNVFRVELTVYVDNHRAIALYKKFGFEMEGTHESYALRDGQYVDAHFMARIRPKPLPR